MAHFDSDDHALLTGLLIGHLQRNDVKAATTLTDQFDYLPIVAIEIPHPGGTGWYTVYAQVLPPEAVSTEPPAEDEPDTP